MVPSATMPRVYLMQLFVALALVIAATVLVLWVKDPYGMYPGSRQQAPAADLFWFLRLHKPYAMQKVRAEQLVIGSSRSARLSPSLLAEDGSATYNASLPGISLREMRRMIEHAHAIVPLRRVLVGLDYYMFRPGYSSGMFVDERLLKPDPTLVEKLRHGYQVVLDGWSSLFSVDALLDAYAAVNKPGASQRQFFPDGTWEALVPPDQAGNWVYSMLSQQKYGEFRSGGDELDLTELRALLDFASDQGIEMVVLVSPMHSIIFNAIELAGRWPVYLDWQRRLVDVVEEHPARTSLYGLEHNTDLVTDAIGAQQPLFMDGVHYTSRLGNSVMACLARRQAGCVAGLQPQRLDAVSINAYLAGLTLAMRAYPVSHPREYAALKRWLKLP